MQSTTVDDVLLGRTAKEAKVTAAAEFKTKAEALKALITKHAGNLPAVALELGCHRVSMFRTIKRYGVREWLDSKYPQKPGPRAVNEADEAPVKAAPKRPAKKKAPPPKAYVRPDRKVKRGTRNPVAQRGE